MNRAERRKEKFKRGPARKVFGSRPVVDMGKVFNAIADRQQVEPKDYVDDLLITDSKIQRLFVGDIEPVEFDDIALRFNMALHRAKEISPELFEMMKDVNVNSMQVIARRWQKWKKFQVTASEKEAILLGQNILEEVVKNSSKLQLNTCWKLGLIGAHDNMNEPKGNHEK